MKSANARRRASVVPAAIALTLATMLAPRLEAAVTNELVVADQLAGVALFGFDPVNYFLEGSPRPGSESFELLFGGFTWRFRSEANRAAFRDRPDAYVPRFGGYDPIALVRGVPVAGHPTMFVVHENQLFLFHQPENRAKFLADPAAAINTARSAWPLARRSLVH
jgi:hypothetical protein